jgi:hypothetical protein
MLKQAKKLLLFLFLSALLLSFTSCKNTVSVYRNYAGENENYKVSVRIQFEYDGSSKVPKGLMYDDENLTTMMYYDITYIGTKDVENLQITGVEWGNKYYLLSQNQIGGYMNLFDEDNKYSTKDSMQTIDITEHAYYVQFTYADGTTERINTQLTSSKGELTDLDLVFTEKTTQN